MTITHASIIAASDLTDTELSAVLGRLAQDERKSTVALIVHLAEFDARRLYEPAGFSSLFKYCRAVLRLSEDAVYNRIRAARAARRYPVIVDMLLSGALSPTTARLLARHLTPANHEVLLAAASGKGRDDVEELLAERFPRAEVTARVRKLRTPQAIAYPAPPAPPREPLIAPAAAASLVADPPPFMAPPSPSPTALVRPLALERYEVRFTATRAMRDKLRLAQDLLGHAVPSGDLAQVFDRALTALVADLSRTKFAATPAAPGEPRPGGGIAEHPRGGAARGVDARWRAMRVRFPRRPPLRRAPVRRVPPRHPHSAGGKPTVENIQLRCRPHNGHEVDLFFGPDKRYTREDEVCQGRAAYGRELRSAHSSQDEYSYRIGPIGGLRTGRVGPDAT